jgi:glycosyltransferase involved in cell wall biosynthesis
VRFRAGATPRPTHIVVLNWRDIWHPEGGGSEVYIHQIAQRLIPEARVTWVTARYRGSARRESVGGIDYVRAGGHMSVYLWTVWLLLTRRLGHVDAVLEVQNGVPFLARWFTRAPVVVLVHHVHREQWSVVGPLLARVGWFLESRVAVRANRGNRYLAVSDVTRRELVELGVRAGDVGLAHNGLPPVPVYDDGPRSSSPVLVVLSRLVPHKQIDHVIRAMPSLTAEFPDITLRILGSGWWDTHLTDLTEELGLQDSITFLGHVSDRAKFEELSRAWVHVLPSLKEGWGLSIMEAAYTGTPSVAYASAGGVTESILDEVTGLLAQDETDLVPQIQRLLGDDVMRREMSDKARQRATEFTWEAAVLRIKDALLLERTPA